MAYCVWLQWLLVHIVSGLHNTPLDWQILSGNIFMHASTYYFTVFSSSWMLLGANRA